MSFKMSDNQPTNLDYYHCYLPNKLVVLNLAELRVLEMWAFFTSVGTTRGQGIIRVVVVVLVR